MRKHIFKMTPLGKADHEIREYLKDNIDEEQFQRYESALNHYRHLKVIQLFLKIFLYAGLVTSFAATIGLPQAYIIQKVASYVGLSVIFMLYAVTNYITMIRRENYHVQREILIAEATQ